MKIAQCLSGPKDINGNSTILVMCYHDTGEAQLTVEKIYKCGVTSSTIVQKLTDQGYKFLDNQVITKDDYRGTVNVYKKLIIEEN